MSEKLGYFLSNDVLLNKDVKWRTKLSSPDIMSMRKACLSFCYCILASRLQPILVWGCSAVIEEHNIYKVHCVSQIHMNNDASYPKVIFNELAALKTFILSYFQISAFTLAISSSVMAVEEQLNQSEIRVPPYTAISFLGMSLMSRHLPDTSCRIHVHLPCGIFLEPDVSHYFFFHFCNAPFASAVKMANVPWWK